MKAAELLLLHALPLDGSMWAGQRDVLPGATSAPTLYSLGDSVEDWAAALLKRAKGGRLIVVGCSVGGSCALELAAMAPDRVAALVLIGTKAAHRPDNAMRDAAMTLLREKGMEEAWLTYWAPLFEHCRDDEVVARARRIALRQSPDDVARGVLAFHSRPGRGHVLADFSGPVALVTGAWDMLPGYATNVAQAELARRSTLHLVPGCGHYVPMERPAALNAILRAIIDAL